MKVLHTVIAFVILLALGGVLYYLRQQPASQPENLIPKKKFLSFEPDNVQEFSIEMPGQPTATFRRLRQAAVRLDKPGEEAGKITPPLWEIVTPTGITSDSLLIQAFVDELPKMECTPLEAQTPGSLAEYGLDPPEKVFKFKLKQGQPLTLSIGKENPSGYARYGMLDSSGGIFLLDSADTRPLQKTLFDLRNQRALPLGMDTAKRLELFLDLPEKASAPEGAGSPARRSKIVMTKLSNSNWELTEPKARTDYGTTNYFVTILTGALMKSVEEEQAQSLSRYGLDKPQIRLNVITPEGTYNLLVGNKKEQDGEPVYYAKNSVWPHVFTINETVYQQLQRDADAYRNRFLFDFETNDVTRLEIQGPQGELRLEKKGQEWVKMGGPQGKVITSAADAFLISIHALRIQQYTTDQPGRFAAYGMTKPWMKVKITFGKENREETVLFAAQDKRFYAARQGEPSVYELSANEQESVEAKLKDITT